MTAPLSVKLRYFQKDAVDAEEKYLKENKTGNGVIVLPTAAGKSYTLAEMIRRFSGILDARTLVVSHTKNIIQQDFDSTVKLWPDGRSLFGINSAGLGSRDVKSKVIFGGVQSMFNSTKEIGEVNFLIPDECHHISMANSVHYRRFIMGLLDQNPKMRVCGLSASPWRMDSGLVYGPSKDLLFDDLVYSANLKELMFQGYLSKPITPIISKENRIDTEGVKIATWGAKDYVDSELNERVNIPSLIKSQTKEVLENTIGLKSIAAFAVNIDHAENIAASYREQGETSVAVVHSKIKGDSQKIIADYKALKIRVLVSVNMFIEGFDAPNIQVEDIRKPTKSPGRDYQMLGRGFRLCPELNKTTFIVFDFAGNRAEHGPVDQIKPPIPGEKNSEKAPKKQCGNPVCEMMCHARVRQCPHCGYLFPPPEISEPEDRTNATAGSQSIISEPKWFPVKRMECIQSKNKPAISVQYFCKGGKFRTDILWDESGLDWLKNHLGDKIPFDIKNFFSGGFRSKLVPPKRIYVDEAGLSSKILKYEF